MRCGDITETWGKLREWLEASNVLVLPALEAFGPIVRLDADIEGDRDATPEEQERALGRVTAVVESFGVRAVYVGQTGTDGPAAVTIRVMAGGVVHELAMVASWYAEAKELATAVDGVYAG
jgi:hypothetical protein